MAKIIRYFLIFIFLIVGINHSQAQLFRKKYYTSEHGTPIGKKEYKKLKRKKRKELRKKKKADKKRWKYQLSLQDEATRKRMKANYKKAKKEGRRRQKRKPSRRAR